MNELCDHFSMARKEKLKRGVFNKVHIQELNKFRFISLFTIIVL